jgi:hypothetical protein
MARILKVAGICAVIGALVLLITELSIGQTFASNARMTGETLGSAFAIFAISALAGSAIYWLRGRRVDSFSGVGTTVGISIFFVFAASVGILT